MKLHWRAPYEPWMKDNLDRPACHQWNSTAAIQLTDDPAEVTCQQCNRRILDAFESDGDRALREGRRKASQAARSRAVSALIDKYRDEFEQLWRDFTEQLVEEYRQKELEYFEARSRYGDQQRARRKAELERELAAL